MSNENIRPIVVKRVKKKGGGHHGGAWKIAYADFVTAMMAFFLLMWLLGSTAKGDLQGIAEYFQNPLKVAASGGTGAGNSSSVIPGGGMDLARKDGQKKLNTGETTRRKDESAMRAELEKQDAARLKVLKKKLNEAIEANPVLRQFKNQLLIDITTEGLRIQLVDEKNRPMFELSKADLLPHTKQILHEVASVLNDVPNKISLSGHTDAKPYPNGDKGYSNWELSADRANASRRELIAGGLADNKIVRVVGLSSAVLFDTQDPFNPINRRISIIVMNKKAEESAAQDGGTISAATENDVVQELQRRDQ